MRASPAAATRTATVSARCWLEISSYVGAILFSGIVEAVGTVAGIADSPGGRSVAIRTPRGWRLREGESVAVDGVCSTVQRITPRAFHVVYMHETLRRTTLGGLEQKSLVNLERSLSLNSLIGGHLVQGHVDGTSRITAVRPDGNAKIYRFELPPRYSRYIVEKGSVALDGISLTVAGCGARWFTVSLLEYTLGHTTLGAKSVNGRVNLEVDMIAKYLEKLQRCE